MSIRDDAGDFVLARIDWFSSPCDATIGEAVGLLPALQWVSDLQFDKVDFVLYSHQVVNPLHTRVYDDSELDCIITAYRKLFQDSFQNSHVEFTRR